MTSTITVTGTSGPGKTLTAQQFTDVSKWEVNSAQNLLTMYFGGETFVTVDISDATTFTVTISGGNYTVVIS